MSVRYAFLCDFDGTVSPADIGAAFIRRFTAMDELEARALLERWRAGELGSREVTELECRTLAVSEVDALSFTRGFSLDSHFAAFTREARARGDQVMVVSDGLEFYVRDHLERAGLGELPWSANGSRFTGGTVIPDFPPADGGCGRCGNCKRHHVRSHQAQGFEVVLVGDGLSDRCGARAADRVMARGELLTWCDGEGIPTVRFESFADVAEHARRLPRTGGPAERAEMKRCASAP